MPARLRACDRSRMRNRCDIDMIPAALAPPGRGSPYGFVGDRGVSSWFAWTGHGRRRLRGAWLVLPGLLLSACGEADQTPAAAPPPPAVSVVEVEPQDVTPSSQFVGRVVSIDQVDLRARVQGFLEQRLFTEGQKVKKGDLLYVIEQPPFQAQVDEAAADVARAEASVAETKATLGARPGGERQWCCQQAGGGSGAGKRPARPGRGARRQGPAGDCQAQSQLYRNQRADRRPDRLYQLHGRQPGRPGQWHACHDRQRRSDLRHLPGQQPGHSGGPPAGHRSRQAKRVRRPRPAARWHDLRSSRQGQLPQHRGRPDHRHHHGPRRVSQSRGPSGRWRVRQCRGGAGQARRASGRAAGGPAARSGGRIRAGCRRPGPGRAATGPDRPGIRG